MQSNQRRARKRIGERTVNKDDLGKCSVERVAKCFQLAHGSSVEMNKQKKKILEFWKENPCALASGVANVTLLVLREITQISKDVLKRHYIFLEMVAKACMEENLSEIVQSTKKEQKDRAFVDKDHVAIETIKSVLSFHNANDKLARLGVVTVIERLLKAVDQENTTETRQDLYQSIAELLKYRLHDRCPNVRERSAAAIAAFQTGKRDCDVTQQLMALLCTDGSADVRQQILRSIATRKEFLEGYFHGMTRCTGDVIARVRAEAWDALGRFSWRYITAYGTAKKVNIALLIYRGLQDTNSSVVIACSSAVTNSWLHRDSKGDPTLFLHPIVSGFAFESLEPFSYISETIFRSCKRLHANFCFPLPLDDVHTSALLMWKADCKAASESNSDMENEAETTLISLEIFSQLFEDVVYCYTRPGSPTTVAKFRTTDDADNMLRIILSFFSIYQEDGYLAHADNTTCHRLLKTIGFLLKVVPDDDPSLFVDDSVRVLKALSERNPEEAANVVSLSLDLLFRSLKLPQRYGLGFEDVESFGRKTREHQQELLKLKLLIHAGHGDAKAYEEMSLEAERDEKFLLRIQFIAWSYLSNSERGDNVPNFCSHVIQLGRHSHREAVQIIATKSLGLQCLIRPETVHTFLPLILSDASLPLSHCEAESLPVAAVSVVFDLVMEYSLTFFSIQKSTLEHDNRSGSIGLTKALDTTEGNDSLSAEAIRTNDEYKVGSSYLLHTLSSFLHPSNSSLAAVAVVGCCKLLSANRFPKEQVPFILGFLLLHFSQFECDGKPLQQSAYMVSLLEYFFRGYASSHYRRQSDLISGGIAALNLLLLCTPPSHIVSKFIVFLLRTGDAFLLAQIRDIDPDVAKDVQHQAQSNKKDGDNSQRSSARSSSNLALRSSTTRSSMYSGRLMKELSRYSQHERVAEHLLLFILDESISDPFKSICVEALEKHMYLYNTEPQSLMCLLAQKVAAMKENESLSERIQLWLDEYLGRFQRPFLPIDPSQFSFRTTQITEGRKKILHDLLNAGARSFRFLNPDEERQSNSEANSHPAVVTQKRAAGSKRLRDDDDSSNDPFNLKSIFHASSMRSQ